MNAPETVTHQQAMDLLPWLANESLTDAERQAVFSHTRFCVTCRSELESLEDIGRTIADESAAQAVPAPDMRRINRRIDELTARRSLRDYLSTKLRGLFANPWRTAFAAQAVVLAVAAVLWVGREQPAVQFTTLTRAAELPAGDYFRVVFSTALDDMRIEQLLDDLKLSVADGPSQRGVYTLSVQAEENRETVLAALRGNSDVLLAEPVYVRARE